MARCGVVRSQSGRPVPVTFDVQLASVSSAHLFMIVGSRTTARSSFTLMRSAAAGSDLSLLKLLRLLGVALFHLLGLLLVPLLHLLLSGLGVILLLCPLVFPILLLLKLLMFLVLLLHQLLLLLLIFLIQLGIAGAGRCGDGMLRKLTRMGRSGDSDGSRPHSPQDDSLPHLRRDGSPAHSRADDRALRLLLQRPHHVR